MLLPATEKLPQEPAIDTRAPLDAAAFLLHGQQAALDAVGQATRGLERGADIMATAIRSGKSIHYFAAGSSGLMALADACELPGTFGISAAAIHIHMAGGVPTDAVMPGATEDDDKAAQTSALTISQGDVAIVLSASGSTPFALAAAKQALAQGAQVIALANNPGTPLLDLAQVAICLETPSEVIAGSTRLGAGTAQKAALNLMSTLMGIKLGHVYQGHMVNLVADNAKLMQRALAIVADIAGVSRPEAQAALATAQGQTKPAILVAAGIEISAAEALLKTHDGHLGRCFHAIKPNQDVTV
jgi:N-acetylmuramic acid 6-phosphate etherase